MLFTLSLSEICETLHILLGFAPHVIGISWVTLTHFQGDRTLKIMLPFPVFNESTERVFALL